MTEGAFWCKMGRRSLYGVEMPVIFHRAACLQAAGHPQDAVVHKYNVELWKDGCRRCDDAHHRRLEGKPPYIWRRKAYE